MSPEKIKNRDSKLSFNAKRGIDGKLKIILCVFLFFVLFNFSLHAATVCTPQAAVLCAAVDDIADVYINGIYLATFGYVDVSLTGQVAPKCMQLNTAQLNSLALAPFTNVIAVHDQNTECCEMWATWSMDITCTDGGHSYVDSDSGNGVDYSEDTNVCCNPTATPVGTAVSCDLGPTEGGLTWYNPLYNENGTWASASTIVYNGTEYGQKISSFEFHSPLPPLGFGSIATGCQQVFYRQGFTLNEEPTPKPPAMTISKTLVSNTFLGGNNEIVSFAFHICNTGGGTTQTVWTNDQWTDQPVGSGGSGYQYQGPYGANSAGFVGGFYYGDISSNALANNLNPYLIFEEGFPGVTCTGCTTPCYDFTWLAESWNIVYCENWYNSVTLTWQVGNASSGVPVTNFCPSKTFTPTNSPTYTATPTATKTFTITPTPVFTLVKTSNITTISSTNTNLTFTLSICNNSGAATQDITVIDDYSSDAGDGWQYQGPYYTGNPGPGLASLSGSSSAYIATFILVPTAAGFTGCFTWQMYLSNNSAYSTCNWNNNASLSYPGQAASPVSTVNMADTCKSPTWTPTFTISPTVGQSPTYTPTFTPTKTYTITPTYTYTATSTYTSTPALQITLTKTESLQQVPLGGQVQYCLQPYNNASSAASVNLWDTIPSVMTFVSCTGGCSTTTYGPNVVVWWTGVSVPANSSTSVCFTVQVTSIPYLLDDKELFAMVDSEKYFDRAAHSQSLTEPEKRISSMIEISRGSP